MINQYEATRILMEKIDELAIQNYPSNPSLVIYATICHFSDYTKKALTTRNALQITKCFELAEYLYLNGEKIVRTLIEDSFIFSVSSVMSHKMADQFFMKATGPKTLYQLYKNHLLTID
jgi:hypothetical protein